MSELGYRPCVGVMLVNAVGEAFVGKRIDNKEGDWWQMPQGGIDKGEDPLRAALRELHEETNITSVSLLAEAPEWIYYDLPDEALGIALKGKYRGQRQRWFELRFLGTDADIRLDLDPHPEFDAWRWAPLAELPGMAVAFKREIYTVLARDFARFAKP